MRFFPRKWKSNLSDEELLKEYRSSGDKAFVGELYIRYSHLVYGLCLNYFRDRELARDAVLQLFEKLMTVLTKNEPENFKMWLTFVARNHCISELRKIQVQRDRKQEYASAPGEDNTDREELLKKEERLSRLEEAVKLLGEEQRKCIELFYFSEKSYEEISEITGYSEKQVKSYLQNGKRNLKIIMEENQ
ncbi:MAG TPA: sigma-70 family RNA polymerase sigma factor [Bacteroidia bacterium]|nr:sigma-70 family RNA polymerase sigma factor [Bacteroidia bacterium]